MFYLFYMDQGHVVEIKLGFWFSNLDSNSYFMTLTHMKRVEKMVIACKTLGTPSEARSFSEN